MSDDFKQASHRQLPAEQDDHSSPCLAPAELEALGFRKRPLLQVIRTKCLPGNKCFKFGIAGSSRHAGRRPGTPALL